MHAESLAAKPLSAGLWQYLIQGGGQPKAGDQHGACKTAVPEDPYFFVSVLTPPAAVASLVLSKMQSSGLR